MVKNCLQCQKLPAVQEMWVRSLGQADSLEKKMTTHSSVLSEKNPMGRGVQQATHHGVARVGHDLVTKPPTSLL